jgi:hypothetical protein
LALTGWWYCPGMPRRNHSFWSAAGSAAPRRFRQPKYVEKAVSPLRSATAVQIFVVRERGPFRQAGAGPFPGNAREAGSHLRLCHGGAIGECGMRNAECGVRNAELQASGSLASCSRLSPQ